MSAVDRQPAIENSALSRRLSNLMEDFSSSQRANSATVEHSGNSTFLSLACPTTLAAFFAFCNGRSAGTTIYLRGCTKNYDTAYPSLFRELPDTGFTKERLKRWRAYQYVLHSLRNLTRRRWRRKNLGAVLQHYGIRTPWLDVVRNLYYAVWFATHETLDCGLGGVVQPAVYDYGWISFFRRRVPSMSTLLTLNDISALHSSTHLRPHTQHGASLAMQSDDAKTPNQFQEFNRFRVAQVRIPNNMDWKFSGQMGSADFMFPSRDLDDSFRRLSTPAVQDILRIACMKFGIPSTSLGKISGYT